MTGEVTGEVVNAPVTNQRAGAAGKLPRSAGTGTDTDTDTDTDTARSGGSSGCTRPAKARRVGERDAGASVADAQAGGLFGDSDEEDYDDSASDGPARSAAHRAGRTRGEGVGNGGLTRAAALVAQGRGRAPRRARTDHGIGACGPSAGARRVARYRTDALSWDAALQDLDGLQRDEAGLGGFLLPGAPRLRGGMSARAVRRVLARAMVGDVAGRAEWVEVFCDAVPPRDAERMRARAAELRETERSVTT